MSFGGGFGGFGQNNNANNNQQTGFGGFGSPAANTGTAFGSGNTGGGAFGQTNNAGGGLFGNNNNNANNNAGGFGASTGGFGANTGGGFGSKPAFGSTTATTGGGLFGSSGANNNTTTGFGGFGNTGAANNNTQSPFGGGNTAGGGVFGGGNKTGFGSTTGGTLFGSGNNANTGTGFGSGGFGASNNTSMGASGDPPGTAVTPFQAFTEKEASGTSNSYQNILFQDPYKKWSAEELRLADYVQGRRHGNASGAGAFGVSSGFGGGFGATNNQQQSTTTGFGASTSTTGGGLFGAGNNANNSNTGGGFGNTGSAFGSSTGGGGLFGTNKPAATGGLFGGGQTGQTGQQQQTGGMFGSTNTAGGGFGATNTGGGFGSTTNTTGGGLFGNSQAQKPQGTGFSFGGTANNTTTTTGFGGTTNNAFGANNNNNAGSGGGLFGNSTQSAGGGGLFGNNTQQQQQNTGTGFGGLGQQNQAQTGGGLFGNSQAKPATTGGLFGGGATQTGGGLFGNNTQQQTTGGFGAANTASTGGGLFGAAKPTTGGGLFGGGATAQNNNAGGTGLLGGLGNNQQNQQTGGTGLFGASSNTQQQKTGLFGASTQQSGGLFGSQNNQNQGSSLFGGNNQQQPQNSTLGNSFLGNSQQQNNAPQGLTANLNDVSAYGAPGLFANLGGNEVSNPGPLATPLNGNSKPRRSSILPMYKLAPASASRYATPQKRGFGFSYSAYGTPGGSPASSISSTPGTLGRSLLGSSSSGSLSKSVSANNLRRNFNTEDSILAAGAFSASTSARWYGSTGSKKLVINRDIRSDLFSTPQKDKQGSDANGSSRKLAKRVSFDTSTVESGGDTPVRGALPAPEDVSDSQVDDTPRQSRSSSENNGSKTPEMEQAKGKELAIVHEEDNATTSEAPVANGFDNAPGNYWMTPAKDDLYNMNRIQRQRVDGFTVGRDNVGYVSFKIPVDLSAIDLDDICGGIIQLEPRSATVYPVAAKKPPVGKGLNVPARISLEQSWPRGGRDKRVSSDPKRFNKHVDRLKRIPDTTFESYDKETGVWVFSVEHFTTYGLDDSDEDDDEDMSAMPPVQPQPNQPMALDAPVMPANDDAFRFSQGRGLPGAFDEPEAFYEGGNTGKPSFLGVSSADSAPNDVWLSLEDNADMGEEYDVSDNEDETRSFDGQHLAAELDEDSSDGGQETNRGTPGGILRARMRAMKDSAGPVKLEVADGDDWMEMLRKTVSPVKRDRHLLRELNVSPSKQTGRTLLDDDQDDDLMRSSIWGKSVAAKDKTDGLAASTMAADKGRGFATSIDLMNSLFEKPKPKPARQNLRASMQSKGFPQWPYERQDKNLTVDDSERAFHDASRPTWGPDETLVVTKPRDTFQARRSIRDNSGILTFQRSGIQTERQDLRLARFATEPSTKYLRSQDQHTEIKMVDNVPMAKLRVSSLKNVFHHQDMNDPSNVHEKRVWELASILFDNITSSEAEAEYSLRKANLSQFWTELVDQEASNAISLAGSSEEKAVACLAGHRIAEACKHLLDGKNFRLGTLVPLIGMSHEAKRDMKEQLKAWHDAKMLSEFSEPIRTIYELLSGNVCVCAGMKNVPLEDRMESFVISKRFGLDWRQAFGLRLWYGISGDDDLASAVDRFKDDISQDKEDVPRPWFAEQGIKPLWTDEEADKRQDLLWGLLQLYADEDADLQAILRPENSRLSPLDMRLCWQLGQALVSTGKVSYGQSRAEKADAATLSYAAQLTSAGEWLEAVFVLLHLTDAKAREKAIQDHLCRHAGLIGTDSGPNFGLLTDKFRIPAAWLWEALALYMRSVKKDASGEVHCLLRAGSFVEAHRVLVQQVAPAAVIERDYATLSSLIAQFEGRHASIQDWRLGGEIYSYFLTLVQHRSKGEAAPAALLERLLAGLNAMNEDVGETDIKRYAAVSDMADETAREILKLAQKKQDMELRSRILHLPLTQDRLLAYSIDLGLDRYQEVVSY